jgi:uncharacterized protein
VTKPLVIVFLKAPRLGAVKTRLARGIGPLAAWRFYRKTVANLLRRVGGDPRWDTVIAVTPDRHASESTPLFQEFQCVAQGHGDLGRRMARALLTAGRRPVVLVGGDIPTLNAAHIARAIKALGRADLTFGPAADGGFWLVGARWPRRDARRLFDRVRWSGPFALKDTLANVGRGRRVEFVDTLNDVDTPEDYLALSGHHKTV